MIALLLTRHEDPFCILFQPCAGRALLHSFRSFFGWDTEPVLVEVLSTVAGAAAGWRLAFSWHTPRGSLEYLGRSSASLSRSSQPTLASVIEEDERERGSKAERADLVSKLAHEIRGPVSTIRGLAGTTLVHYERLDDGERREFLELIRREADRLERTVDQVVLALKLDAGTVRFDVRRQDLGPIVRGVVQGTETGDHPLEVDAEASVEAPVDSIQITFAVRQLIANAAAFSPPDSPISVRLFADGGDAVIEVGDRGPGIPPDRREEVFERFADWRPTGYEHHPGTGLGLFLCRALVRAHGGEASIGDGPRGGTMLTIRLPVEG